MLTLDDLFDEYKHLWHKKVTDSTDHYWGTFVGVSSDEMDYYYVIQQDDLKIVHLTAVTGLKEFKE